MPDLSDPVAPPPRPEPVRRLDLLDPEYRPLLIRADRSFTAASASRQLVHDLRNPIQAMVLAAHGILAALPTGSSRKLALLIASSAERLVASLEAFDAYQWGPGSAPVSLRIETVIDAVLAMVAARRMGGPTVTLRQTLAPGLPSVRADPDRLRHAVLNLAVNSVEALAAGEGGTVTIIAEPAEGGVRLVVEDDGPGIPEHLLEGVFAPLMTTKDGRAGLGLAVARMLIEEEGGRLWAEIREGSRGARLVAWLPVAPVGDR